MLDFLLIATAAAAAYAWLARSLPRHDDLRSLDERMLRDLGLDASEILSIDAEHRGFSEPTRRRLALRRSHA
jgi:hypothetical protein